MLPAHSVNNIETKPVSFNTDQTALPYALAQAVKNMPITLYSQNNCSPCTDGKNFLIKNGIPFSEKIISSNEEVNKLTQISGGQQVPVLFIGKHKKHRVIQADEKQRMAYHVNASRLSRSKLTACKLSLYNATTIDRR